MKRGWFTLSIVVAIVYLILSVTVFYVPSFGEFLKNHILENSFYSGFLYVITLILSVVFAPLSAFPLIPLAVYIFGPFLASLYNILGWSIGAVIAFVLARSFGKSILSRFMATKDLDRFEMYVPAKAHFWILVIFRMIIPVDVLSYALGLFSSISYPTYIFSTILGIIPFSFIFSYGSGAVISGKIIVALYIAIFAFLVFFFAYLAVYRKKRHTQGMKTIVTHSGVFHADDVFSVATLLLLFPDSKVVRTRDPKMIQIADIVVDVGSVYDPLRHRFDHHQSGGAGERENKIPYASFGLVWKNFGGKLCGSKEVVDDIDLKIACPIDANDNGVELTSNKFQGVHPYCIDKVISAFRPTWLETNRSLDESFLEAVDFAKKILKREIVKASDKQKAISKVRKVYEMAEDKRIIVFEENITWSDILNKYHEPIFAIYPKDGNWRAEAVRDDTNTFVQRKNFPAKWAGKRDEDLANVTGVKDAIFCHNARFLVVTGSKESAITLAKKALGK